MNGFIHCFLPPRGQLHRQARADNSQPAPEWREQLLRQFAVGSRFFELLPQDGDHAAPPKFIRRD